jgi:hypothetical protein
MKTENLTAILATNLEPVDSRRTTRRYVLGTTAGALAGLALTGGVLHLNPERQDHERCDVNLIAYLPQAVTNVGRGKNSGRTLREFNIVRQYSPLGVWSGRESVFRAPVDSIPDDATHIAVLLQRNQQGPIVVSATAVLR